MECVSCPSPAEMTVAGVCLAGMHTSAHFYCTRHALLLREFFSRKRLCCGQCRDDLPGVRLVTELLMERI